MHRLLYIAYGREDIKVQALYGAMTALAHAGELPLTIHLYTDDPSFFARIAGRVQLRPATAAEVAGWVGANGFPLRAKPAVFRDLASRQRDEPILLVDADTFFVREVASVFSRIGPRSAVMWEREYHVATADTAVMHRFRRRVRPATFRGERIDFSVDMWNSGAVGLHPNEFPLVDDWLAFVDEVYPRTRRWILEQFAMSYVLQRAGCGLSPCDDALVHYWFDKPGHFAAVRAALERTRALPLEEALRDIRSSPIDLPRARQYGKKANFFQRVFGW